MRLIPMKDYFESQVCEDLKREIDLHDSFFNDLTGDSPASNPMPKIEMSETKKDIVVKAELPGLDVKDIDLSVNNGYLTISGEKRNESEEEQMNSFCRETSYGYFRRTVELPGEVDEEKIKADYKGGVLKVVMPKANVKNKKAIKIETH
ncbi:MAG: Hsp20/alpha crystallin family protein [Deltaproteobacteria bacterium]|nr:Hsp20/alpha crystallin family protein [Candidatus Zymogenaceae bacterium]